VQSREGPALSSPAAGEHTGLAPLVSRFGPNATEMAVDGDELAHGDGPPVSLTEIRLASPSAGQGRSAE